jgi:putative DNA primase/helicase
MNGDHLENTTTSPENTPIDPADQNPNSPESIDPRALALLNHLHRGGQWSNYWTKLDDGRRETLWWPAGKPAKLPSWPAVYFGVHPSAIRKDSSRRSTIQDIQAINCLFAEFDAKDYGDKNDALSHIMRLEPQPSVIIDSGGGYHCYWLLDNPRIIGEPTDREAICELQARWVERMGGDPNAKDLARVLRMPGSTNHKYTPARMVSFYSTAFDRLYSLEELQAAISERTPAAPAPQPVDTDRFYGNGNAGQHWLKKALDRASPGNRNATGLWLACQLRDAGLSMNEAENYLVDYASRVPSASGNPYTEDEALASLLQAYKTTRREPAKSLTAPSNNGHHPAEANPPSQVQAAADPNKKSPKPTDDELRDRWLERHPGTAYGLGEWRRYKAGVWSVVEEDTIAAEIVKILEEAKGEGIRPTRNAMASVMELARVKTFIPDDRWDCNPDIVPCKNGVLNSQTVILSPHRPDNYLTSALPFDYDPKATAATWDYFLKTTVPDAAPFLQEYAGECLTTDTRFELALWLTGPRGSGKSTFEEGLIAMNGDRATVLGLADIERSRFSLYNLRGKTLAIASEQPALYIQSSHILNAIISGEILTIERKFKDPIDLRTHVKIVWAMNELPRVPDAGNGLFRRVKVIKFPAIPEEQRNPQIKELIKGEGAGILNWALEGLRRLRDRGRFDIPACVKGATEHFQETNDIPAVFVADCCLIGDGLKVRSGLLYEEYKAWCETNGHKAKSSTSIADDWDRLGFQKKKEPSGMFWHGIGLTSGQLP